MMVDAALSNIGQLHYGFVEKKWAVSSSSSFPSLPTPPQPPPPSAEGCARVNPIWCSQVHWRPFILQESIWVPGSQVYDTLANVTHLDFPFLSMSYSMHHDLLNISVNCSYCLSKIAVNHNSPYLLGEGAGMSDLSSHSCINDLLGFGDSLWIPFTLGIYWRLNLQCHDGEQTLYCWAPPTTFKYSLYLLPLSRFPSVWV